MSLTDLAAQLSGYAKSGPVPLQSSTLSTNTGLTPPAGLDTLLEHAFQLSAVPLGVANAHVGPPTATELTMTGAVTAWGVNVNPVTITFKVSGTDLNVVLLAPLGTWKFSTSFQPMQGFPFDELQLVSPAFIFAGTQVTGYAGWSGGTLILQPGLNFAALVTVGGPFAPLLGFLATTPSGQLVLSGTVDPSVIDGKTLGMPNVALTAPLATGALPKLRFLSLDGADFGVEVATEKTLSGPAQYTDASLLTKLDFGDGKSPIDCRISVQAGTDLVTLLLFPDPNSQTAPSVAALFRAMGGASWYSVIPPPLQSFFTEFGFKGFQAEIDAGKTPPALQSVALTVGSLDPWTIFDPLTLEEIDLEWRVDDPLGEPVSSGQLGGLVTAMSIFKGGIYFSITTDFQIAANYQGDLKLTEVIGEIAGTHIQLPAHMDLDLTELDLLVDVPRKAYSIHATADASMDILGNGALQMAAVELSLATVTTAKGTQATQATFNGTLTIGPTTLALDVEYDSGSWKFEGGLAPGSTIPLGDVIDALLRDAGAPPDWVPGTLQVAPLWFTADVPAQGTSTYTAKAGVTWVLEQGAGVLTGTELDARIDLAYDGKDYSGSIAGEVVLPVVGLDVVLEYDFSATDKALSIEWKDFAKATYDITNNLIDFTIEAKSLGDLLAELIRVVEGDPSFTLDAPWDLLNDISLKGFHVIWRLAPKQNESKVTVEYSFQGNDIKLFFVEIRSLSLSEANGQIQIGLDMKFITDSDFSQRTFPAQSPPSPPGQDTSKFELDLLALGQHVTIAGLDQVTDIDKAVTLLESFAPPDGNTVPVGPNPKPGQPEYAPGSNWLVGTRFKVLVNKSSGIALLDLEAVFNDPILYGLRVTVGGPQAGIFGGLEFEIMYRKVSDTVGVYEIELKLPDWARHLEFGEVSVTLPVVGVDVYTNGDFKIDFGFPANMDFSRSFGIQAFPFTGAGGFYFGVLSNATAPNLPQTTLGTFNPVIVFGIGLEIGLGKSIDEGIFSAQLSVNVFGIVEGVVAPWHPYDGQKALTAFDDVNYYLIEGTVGIVGKLVGSINFAIISADISITVQAFVQMTIEAHRAIPVHMEAGVSVAITVKINLGLFSISIHLSFSLTVKADFAIGSDSHAPWDQASMGTAAAPRTLLARATRELPARSLRPLASAAGLPLTVYAAPHLTLADWTTGTSLAAAYVVGLYLDGPIGRPPASGVSAFEVLARETLLWAIANFGADPGGMVTLDQVNEALGHFTATGPPPVAYTDIRAFLSAHFQVTLAQPTSGDDVASAVALPMIPDLVLGVPAWGGNQAQTIDFSEAGMCQPQYLDDLQALLAKLAVDLETDLQKKYASTPPATRAGAVQAQSLARFVFEDYFALMCRHMLQAAADAFDTYAYLLDGSESLDSIIQAFDVSNGLTPAAIGSANATLTLTGGRPLALNGVTHAALANESIDAIASTYGAQPPLGVVEANQNLQGLLVPGKTLTVGTFTHPIGERDTFATIAAATTGKLADVATAAGPRTDLLVPLAQVAIPSFTYTTTATDTLGGVAAAYGVSVTQLSTDNATVSSLFATSSGKSTFAAVPGLTTLTTDQVGDVLHDSNVYVNLAGIASRFLLNGLRLPVNQNIAPPPGSPCTGQTTCGLQALVGQQITLPALTDTDSYVLTLSRGGQGGWIGFPSDTSLPVPIDNQAQSGGTGQIAWINAVLKVASPALEPKTLSVQALPETQGVARRFVLPTPIPLQLPAPISLPNGAPTTKPTAFVLPDGLLSVLAQPTVRPAFSLQLGNRSQSGGIALTPARAFGWATLVNVTVKRAVAGTATPMSPGSYELVGADPTGIVLLERLLQAIGEGADPIASFQLLFPPNSTAPASAGLQGDDPATVSTFIVQANLSTATAPQGGLALTQVSTVPTDAATFVRVLWECSIVQSGGYALYYEAQPGTPGLPERLFDAAGLAHVQLLLLYEEGASGLGSYVNAAVIGDAIDTTRTSVVAQSEPLTVSVDTKQVDSLAHVAERLHLTPSELAVALTDEPLALGQAATLQIAGGIYETRAGDALAALATRFGTSGPAIQAANPGLQVDWNAIPPWTVLRLPAVTYALAAGAQFTTLGHIAANFSIDVAALGWLNRTVSLLPAATYTVTDELVDATAVLPPGVVGFEVSRTPLSGDPSEPDVYLDANFHLLGYQLIDNLGFTGGPPGLPVGPGDPLGDDQLGLLVAEPPRPADMNGASPLLYEHLLPVATHAKYNPLGKGTGTTTPPASANPYAGVGAVAQPALEWRDLFGNRARTPLTDPTLDPAGPQNEPPVWVGYSDTLLGAAQWPSASAHFTVLAGSPPQLALELSFDVTRYTGGGSPGPAQQAALADLQTYGQAYYQLNQTRPDGVNHVTIAVSTSLDGNAAHVLQGADDAAVRGFVLAAWQYLDALVSGKPVATDPITAAVKLPVAATNAADIYELTVALTFARDPLLVASESRDEAGVATATCAVPPLLDDGNGSRASLRTFAQAFETAYASATEVLKIGVGDSRSGGAGSAEARLLWVVRTGTQPGQPIGCEVTGPPVFWAPPPLSTVPVSRNEVPIWPFDPDNGLNPNAPELHNFTGIDLDVWAREALGAIDQLLSPRYDVPAYVVDTLGKTTYLDRLRAAKRALASAIADTIQAVLDHPAPPSDHTTIADARSKWEQQLLVELGSAYTVDVAVQLPVTVACDGEAGYEAPALYGHPAPQTPTGPYTLSSFKVPAVSGASNLTFLFTAGDAGDQAYAKLDLAYVVDQIEHQIGQIAGIDGYKASTWVTFPIPLPPLPFASADLSTIEIPVVLRAYPDSPMLSAQLATQALDRTNAKTLVDTATQWTYVANYAEQHVAQDMTEATATFNVAPPSTGFMLKEPKKDLFPPLARLLSVLPAIQASFDADLTQLTTATAPSSQPFTRAATALGAFTTLVEDVAAKWAPVPPTPPSGNGQPIPKGTPFKFEIAESRYPSPDGPDLLVTIEPDGAAPSGVPVPALVFDGYKPVATGHGVRYQATDGTFLAWETARGTPGRSVVTGPLEVLGIQNAQLGVQLKRNARLVPSNPTRKEFVYTTPLVTFTNPYTPLLSIADPIDVAAIPTGTPVARTLTEQLQAMLAAFFSAAAPGPQTIQLQVGYSYVPESSLPAGALPPVQVPIALVPSATFQVPADWSPDAACPVPVTVDSPFVCRLAQVIVDWVGTHQPIKDGQLTFDLAAFSNLSQGTLPLVRLSAMTLDRSDVSDL
jgi:LysM repeat protein